MRGGAALAKMRAVSNFNRLSNSRVEDQNQNQDIPRTGLPQVEASMPVPATAPATTAAITELFQQEQHDREEVLQSLERNTDALQQVSENENIFMLCRLVLFLIFVVL
jgi:hypothetical protein